MLIPKKAWVGEPVFQTNFSSKIEGKKHKNFQSVKIKNGKFKM
jgi:hypothetical protein